METKVKMMDCEVTIKEEDGKVMVMAEKDGEMVEDFTVDCSEGSEESEEMEEEREEMEEEMTEAVKSFGQFFKKK